MTPIGGGDFALYMEKAWDQLVVDVTLVQYRGERETWVLTNRGEWRQHEEYASLVVEDLPTMRVPRQAVQAFCAGVLDYMERNNVKTPDAPVNATLRDERDYLRGVLDRVVTKALAPTERTEE